MALPTYWTFIEYNQRLKKYNSMQTNSGNDLAWRITAKQRPEKSGPYEGKYMPLDAEIVCEIWYDHAADKWIAYNSTLGSFIICIIVPLAWRPNPHICPSTTAS